MGTLTVSNPSGYLYIVSDSHLDDLNAPVDEFIEMLNKLENPHTLVCLGDLFKIWLAPPKYWTEMHHKVLLEFKALREKGCNVVFIAGNREIFLPEKLDEKWKNILPFTHLSNRDWNLNWGDKSFVFMHGDTINYNDKRYLRWKSFCHNSVFKMIFQIIPSPVARWIAERLEKTLSQTNKKYKVNFPEKEVKEFAKSVLNNVDYYFVGHFHIDREIKVNGCSGILRIVPDWLSQRKIFKINDFGEIEIIYFK